MQGMMSGYQAFRLRGTLQAISYFCVRTFSTEALKQQLESTRLQAPELLKGALIALDFTQHPEPFEKGQLIKLLELLKIYDLCPIGFSNATTLQRLVIEKMGLPLLRNNQSALPEQAKSSNRTCLQYPPDWITGPVRSGQHIHAIKRDLIILGHVNPGAQIISDGNIHIYGQLRGQAIAGANGDQRCAIFAQSLCAELVSISGIYRNFEQLPTGLEACMIRVQEDQLSFTAF